MDVLAQLLDKQQQQQHEDVVRLLTTMIEKQEQQHKDVVRLLTQMNKKQEKLEDQMNLFVQFIEKQQQRTSHLTTTTIRSGGQFDVDDINAEMKKEQD
jgi:hypothetical protein